MAYMKKKTPLTKSAANRLANQMVGGAITGGVGAKATRTNRTTGAKTTTNKRLTTSSAEEFNSSAKMMKKATPLKKKTSGVRFKAYTSK